MEDSEWSKFLEWLYKAHQVTKDYIPNRTSIEVWSEYQESLTNGRNINA